jgi:hypothetical protein
MYFRNFDVDDPSADTAPIDTDDLPTVKVGNDNNGNVDGTTATRAGTLIVPATGQPNPYDCVAFTNGVSCETDSNGVAKVDYKLTMQPGDNFSVVASPDETYVNSLVPAADGINLKDANNIRTPVTTTQANECGAESEGNKACRSEMLTVWRRLHIEVDSMSNAVGNNVSGTFPSGFKVSTGYPVIPIPVSLEVNRFQNGRLATGGRSLEIFENSPNSISVTNNGGAFSIVAGPPYTIYDDDDFNVNNNTSIDPLDGDEGEDIPLLNQNFLNDNDIVPLDLSTINTNALAVAYVRPKYDLSGANDETTFIANISANTGSAIRNAFQFDNVADDTNTDFWTIYLLSGYQHVLAEDGDPSSEATAGDLVAGITDQQNGQGSIIFLEPLSVGECLGTVIACAIATSKIHEVGHLLNADHTEGGVMDNLTVNYSATSLNKLGKFYIPSLFRVQYELFKTTSGDGKFSWFCCGFLNDASCIRAAGK